MKLMRQRLERVLPANLVAQAPQLLAAELDHLSGADADEVVVGLPAGDHFVVGLLVVEEDLLENSRVLEVRQSSIDGGAADAVAEAGGGAGTGVASLGCRLRRGRV